MGLRLREAAPAKVNLSLSVTGRRGDGYHLLDSLVVFGPAADHLEAAPGRGLSLRITGAFANGLMADDSNLVLRAARALARLADRPADVALRLEKSLPVASGIGGGSADAAATLRLLSRLWDFQPREDELVRLAMGLGADVPVCLHSRPTRMTGIGEVLRPLPPVPSCGLLLTNPGIAIATADVFRARSGPFTAPPAMPEWSDTAGFVAHIAGLRNDLELPAIAMAPEIGALLAGMRALPDCLLARMSGSGATCFGLFASPEQARNAALRLPERWWRCAGPLCEPTPFTNGASGPY